MIEARAFEKECPRRYTRKQSLRSDEKSLHRPLQIWMKEMRKKLGSALLQT